MKRLLLEDKLAATLKDKRRLKKEITSNEKAKEKAESKVFELETNIKKLVAQIEEEKDKNKTTILNLSSLKKEVSGLEDDLKNEKKEKLSISKKLETLEFDFETAKRDISRLKTEKQRLENTLFDLKESSVSLDKIVVSPSKEASALGPIAQAKKLLRGRILVVNKEYSFVVTDLGKDDGVEKGIIFEIRDGADFMGKAKVDKVYDTMSSATLMPGSSISRIRKGNLVIESI